MNRSLIASSLLAAIAALPLAAAAQGASPGEPSGTILVANMDENTVWLIDAATGVRRAEVKTHIAPHEVVLSADGAIAAVTNYGLQQGPGNLVQFVDVASGAVTHEIEVERYQRLHSAAFLPGDSLLAMSSERTGEILIVGVRDGVIRRKLKSGGRATHMLSLGGKWIYAANIVDGTVSRIDPNGIDSTRTWPAGSRTEGVVATPDGLEGWTGSMDAGVVTGVRGDDGQVVARIEGLKVPYRLAVTPDGATIVVSDPEAGTLVTIDRRAGTIIHSIDITAASQAEGLGPASPQGFMLSLDGKWAYVSANAIKRVAIVDITAGRVVRFVEAGAAPDGIAFSPVAGG
jgi:YVTN family beta-propeller protein